MREDYYAYKNELESRDQFTTLSDEDKDNYHLMSIAPQVFSMKKAKRHPFTWAYHVVGIKPRDYQFKMLDYMFTYSKVAGVTSRQIGKSTMVGLFAFWAAYNNIYPSGPQKDTKILIISQTEDAAKKLLRDIDGFITLADQRMSIYTKSSPRHEQSYFRSRLKQIPTQFEIQFTKGNIKVFPPTTRVRGNTADVLIIDEAAFLKNPDPDYFFASEASPTTTATAGKIFLYSTPKSTNGFFHDIIKPQSPAALYGWNRIWFPWTILSVEPMLEHIWSEKDRYTSKGDELDFKIEYEASFLSGKHSYFNPQIIDSCIDESISEEFSWKSPVTMGIDFGDTHSRTVLTVVYNDVQNKKIQLLWYKEFPAGYNNADLPAFLNTLKRRLRFFPNQIVVDDCVGGKTAIELLKREGYNIIPFQFAKSKHEYYEYLKVAFSNQKIKMYKNTELTSQLKSLESVETKSGNIQIRKTLGGRDDIVDALMMACSPFIKPREHGKWRFAGFKLR